MSPSGWERSGMTHFVGSPAYPAVGQLSEKALKANRGRSVHSPFSFLCSAGLKRMMQRRRVRFDPKAVLRLL